MKYIKRLKDFVQYGEYPAVAFRVGRRLGPCKRDYWLRGSSAAGDNGLEQAFLSSTWRAIN
jgi:hypothetical protein